MGWNELSDPDMRTANFEFSCDVYREGVYWAERSGPTTLSGGAGGANTHMSGERKFSPLSSAHMLW